MRKIFLAVVMLVFFAGFGWSVAQKENHLASGKRIVLALAPVDPRSLMQGDYMRLDFALARNIRDVWLYEPRKDEAPAREEDDTGWRTRIPDGEGYAVITLDKDDTAHFVRLHTGERLGPDELLLFYRVRQDFVRVASGSFFFQEGQGRAFEKAKFAELRLNKGGQPLITKLLDADMRVIDGKDGKDGKASNQRKEEAEE